jgi:Suppressor of fused protein (SUFU)
MIGRLSRRQAANSRPMLLSASKSAPEPGLYTYATFGLGAHELALNARTLRQELLLTCRPEYIFWPLEKHLFGAANLALDSHRAYARGDAIDIGDVHAADTRCRLSGFAFVDPARYSDDFALLQEFEPPLILVEMSAITRSEHDQIEARGIDWLLDQFSGGRLDELDYLRPSN